MTIPSAKNTTSGSERETGQECHHREKVFAPHLDGRSMGEKYFSRDNMRRGVGAFGPRGASTQRKAPVVGSKHYHRANHCLNCAQSEMPGGQNLHMETVLIVPNAL